MMKVFIRNINEEQPLLSIRIMTTDTNFSQQKNLSNFKAKTSEITSTMHEVMLKNQL